ncbi:UNVERIFIED_CONTAM: hypothetical protein HHA_310230 [Hammondia hammondi]|eukprot:XP_008886550.1 hypothetical protein HHA_310230 [Hammondia hammondi]
MKLQNSVFFCSLGARLLLACPCFLSPVGKGQMFFLSETRKEAMLLVTSDRPMRRNSSSRGGERLSSVPFFCGRSSSLPVAPAVEGDRCSPMGLGHNVQLANPENKPCFRFVGSNGAGLLLLVCGSSQPKRQPSFHEGFASKRCYWSLSFPVLSTAFCQVSSRLFPAHFHSRGPEETVGGCCVELALPSGGSNLQARPWNSRELCQ